MNKSTQARMTSWFLQFCKSTDDTIFKAYGKPSVKKVSSFDKIVAYYSDCKDVRIRVLGHSCSFYTVGVTYSDETNNYFTVHTPNTTYTCLRVFGDLVDPDTGEVFYENNK